MNKNSKLKIFEAVLSKQSDTCLIGFPWCTKTWLTKQLCELSLLIFPYTPFPSSYLFYLHRSAPKEDIFSNSNTYMNGSGSTTVFITLFELHTSSSHILAFILWNVQRNEDLSLVLWVDPSVHCEIAFRQTREQWYTLCIRLCWWQKTAR